MRTTVFGDKALPRNGKAHRGGEATESQENFNNHLWLFLPRGEQSNADSLPMRMYE